MDVVLRTPSLGIGNIMRVLAVGIFNCQHVERQLEFEEDLAKRFAVYAAARANPDGFGRGLGKSKSPFLKLFYP
jgi:hypothetical protein